MLKNEALKLAPERQDVEKRRIEVCACKRQDVVNVELEFEMLLIVCWTEVQFVIDDENA